MLAEYHVFFVTHLMNNYWYVLFQNNYQRQKRTGVKHRQVLLVYFAEEGNIHRNKLLEMYHFEVRRVNDFFTASRNSLKIHSFSFLPVIGNARYSTHKDNRMAKINKSSFDKN